MKNKDFAIGALYITGGCAAVALCIALLFGMGYLWSKYNVWSSAQVGKAKLAKATYDRQIQVKEAMAKEAAAVDLAKAEIIRAQGVAKANKIIGKSLEGNEAYLRYLWIQNLESSHNKLIYVPTEANLPILEAHRRVK